MKYELRHGQAHHDYADGGPLGQAWLTDVLTSLVQTSSVNPGVFEGAVAKRIGDWFEGTPVEVTYVESLPDRPSVAAVLKGRNDEPRLVLNGHTDTVPIDQAERWTTDPFGAEVRDGYLYGRGSCDMKAGLAAQIAVAHHLASFSDRLKGSLVLHFAIGEELGEPGTLSLLKAGFGGDVGITTEPTELKVSTATRGLAFIQIGISGRSIHASRAHLGQNPIWDIPEILEVVRGYQERIARRTHALLPSGSCTPTMLRSGVAENAVPDRCELVLDRRLLPGESVEAEVETLKTELGGRFQLNNEHELDVTVVHYPYAPAEIPEDSSFVKQVLSAVEDVTGASGSVCGTPFASDVRNLINDAGIEAVTFGPGTVNEAHCADERVSLAQLRDAARVMAIVAEDLLLE